MDSAHICINLSAKSAKHDVLDAAQPVNVCESQHGNDDSESNSTPLLKSVDKMMILTTRYLLTLHILQQYHIERGERIFYAVL